MGSLLTIPSKFSPVPMKTILSYGMGVESSALILKWVECESFLDFDLTADLIVITAQVRDEYPE